ncbi:MAG TPA: ATPase, T2SS/T4P/T4SS family [Candidatus Wallbacteria bacterium]|nr:ATPase, T2SS/T4P/T4SS family [Candidatus Wallbacteria bacterium]
MPNTASSEKKQKAKFFEPSFDETVGKILVEKKYLTDAELQNYMKACASQKKRLGTILLENNILSRRDLYSIILSQMKNKDLPTVLVEEKFISFDELTRVFLIKKGNLRKLGKYLITSGILSEQNFAHALAKAFDLTYIAPAKLEAAKIIPDGVDPSFFTTFLTVITKYSPKSKEIEFAICDPSNIGDILNSSFFASYKISFVITSFSAILKALENICPKNARSVPIDEFSEIEVNEQLEEFKSVKSFKRPSNFPQEVLDIITDNKNSLVRPLFEILYDSARVNATEIHFEAFGDHIKIFIKINGRFFNLNHSIKPENYDYIVAKIKHLGKLDYQEDRIFQISNFALNLSSLKLFVNALTVPALFGENMVLKILSLNNFPRPLESYFKHQKNYCARLRDALAQKSGLLILSSPDSFGLTRLYYALLNELSKMNLDKKIVSIEKDMICPLNDIAQVEYSQVNEPSLKMLHEAAINLGADIIATSVIHDVSAFEHVQKSLATGALVILTMQEPSVESVLNKIASLKQAKDIFSSRLTVMAAKNVDFICNFCREEDCDESVKRACKVYHGRGCPKCHMTGVGAQSFIFETASSEGENKKILLDSLKGKSKMSQLQYDRFELLINEFCREGVIFN